MMWVHPPKSHGEISPGVAQAIERRQESDALPTSWRISVASAPNGTISWRS